VVIAGGVSLNFGYRIAYSVMSEAAPVRLVGVHGNNKRVLLG